MTATIIHGDTIERMAEMPECSVQVCVTSPPYWGLRKYAGVDPREWPAVEIRLNEWLPPVTVPAMTCCLGLEADPVSFVAHLVLVFRAVRRVLRDDGLCWLNIGDSFAREGGTGDCGSNARVGNTRKMVQERNCKPPAGLKPGDLCGIPWLLATALRADGWYLRNDAIWCLSGGTWIYARTAKGDAPAMLKDLVRLDPATVQLWNGERWTRVVSWTRNETTEQRGHLEIEFRNGERIGCTAEHHWPTQRGVIRADELVVGDVVPDCRLGIPEGESRASAFNDTDMGWLVGFYIAEGFPTDKGVTFAVHAKETAEYERIRAMAELLDGTASMQSRRGNAAAIVVYSRPLREMLAQYASGSTCKNKRLTRKAWMRSNEFLAGVLDGYLAGDGHWDSKAERYRLGFANNDGLAVDLRTLCARLGKVCVLRRAVHQWGEKKFNGWRGEIREASSHRNAKPLGQVIAIRSSRAREYWDIEVADEPHLFALASGLLTHNCKRSPMPESINGTRWERCRVKAGRIVGAGKQSTNAAVLDVQGGGVDIAQWQDCPGCPKCSANDGYVLRRGSWRHTRSHEYIYQLAKSPEYFADAQAVAEKATGGQPGNKDSGKAVHYTGESNSFTRRSMQKGSMVGTDTRNPRSVLHLSSEPTREKHFAAFPTKLVEPLIKASTSERGYCSTCGAPVVRIIEKQRIPTRPGLNPKEWRADNFDEIGQRGELSPNRDPQRHIQVTKTTGWRATCSCGAGTTPAVVLDPFSGTATVGLVAMRLGLDYIGIDASAEYVEIAKRRLKRERQSVPLLYMGETA